VILLNKLIGLISSDEKKKQYRERKLKTGDGRPERKNG
jgi:hypothetical protein